MADGQGGLKIGRCGFQTVVVSRWLPQVAAEGVKRGTIDGGVAKLILARVLPSSRPVQIDLPLIGTGAD